MDQLRLATMDGPRETGFTRNLAGQALKANHPIRIDSRFGCGASWLAGTRVVEFLMFSWGSAEFV
jgi:hypothetical protein